jgi:ubiquinol-cytochrome c reductase cytochrome c subunit
LWRRATIFGVALALALPAVARADVAEGYRLYAGDCASCHDVRGRAPSLNGVGARAADFYLRTGYMPLGHPGEEPKRKPVRYSESQLHSLIDYIASLGPGPGIPQPHPERGSLAAGLRSFTQHCSGCHQVVAKGGYVPDAVAWPLDRATPTQVAEAVRIGPYLMPRFTRRQISDRDLDSVIRYVVSTRHPDDPGGWGIGNLGPVPEGLVAWLIAGAALVGCCVLIGRRNTA